MERSVMTWKMTSTSPGFGVSRISDKSATEYHRHDVNGTRTRPAVAGAMSVDGSNTQSIMDENEEWAKIENIMASLDAGLNDREDGFTVPNVGRRQCFTNPTLPPPPLSRSEIRSVRQWLDSIGLSRLEDILLANGFDDIDFLGPGVMSESDLIEIGVADAASRRRLLSAAGKMPPFTCNAPKQFDGLTAWLGALRLSEYVETFQLHGFTTIDRLQNLWDVELTSVLHVSRLGHRNRIMAAIGILPAPFLPLKGSMCQMEPMTAELAGTHEKQSLNDVSLYKDYTTLLRTRSKPNQLVNNTCEQQQQQQLQRQQHRQHHMQQGDDGLEIRPPKTAGSDIKQWTHKPEALLNSGCSYKVMYVGQGVVDCFNNTSATHEAIVAIRQHCDKTLRGATTITMGISHSGVELIKYGSKEVLGSYSIGNIFCVSQDVEHLDYFAFVTFQPSSNLHYCHVFCAESTQLAVEVVLTLGQAFEVAYQLAVRQNGAVLGDLAHTRSPVVTNNSTLAVKI